MHRLRADSHKWDPLGIGPEGEEHKEEENVNL
jgi:hypothetical protein